MQDNISQSLEKCGDDELLKYGQKLQRGFNLVTVNLQRASELIQNFKRISIDQHNDRLEEISVSDYLSSLVNSLKFEYNKYGHTFGLPKKDARKTRTYPGALAQIFTNLIMNSIKHGFKGETNKRVDIDIEYPADGSVVIHYHDNGCGIPEAIRSKIYEPFFTTDRKDGSGLGLHIVYNLITQKLKGSISLEQTEGSGVYFKIKLPRIDEAKG
jgi:signal transduction histidine kinase